VSVSGANLTDPWVSQGGNPLAPLAALQGIGVYDRNIPFPKSGTYVTTPMKDFRPVYMNQWNLSIQRQIGQDWLLTANYLGNSTIHMITNENINPAVYIPGVGDASGNCLYNGQKASFIVSPGAACSTVANQQSRRLLSLQNLAQGQYYAGIGLIDDGGTASYEGLNLSAQKRLSRTFSTSANYTWSHCISDVYSDNPTANGNAPANNRRLFRSNCLGIDARQLFSMNVVATTPKFSNTALRILGSDWQVAPILSVKSAQLFSVYAGTDRALTTVGAGQGAVIVQPPDLVNPNGIYPEHKTANNWINASAFSPAAPGTYGNLGFNSLKGPGVFQLNLALSRNFVIKERQTIQLRAEAFNLPNHVNLTIPGYTSTTVTRGGLLGLTAPNFGQITSDISGNNGLTSGDYRVIQLALKWLF
jgi:hypothetical protein